MANTASRARVLELVANRLELSGWQQAGRRAEFAIPVVPDIHARLDFAFAGRPPLVSVTPYIAIVHSGIEKSRKFITGRALYTLNKQIQKLMEDPGAHFRWNFKETNMDAAAERLVTDCLEYAPPFYEQFRTLDDVVRGLEEMAKGRRTIMRESLAIAYCLQGRLLEAKEILKDEIDAARSNPRDIANQQLPKYSELFGLKFD